MSLFLMFERYTLKFLLFTFDSGFLFISKVHVFILNNMFYRQESDSTGAIWLSVARTRFCWVVLHSYFGPNVFVCCVIQAKNTIFISAPSLLSLFSALLHSFPSLLYLISQLSY